MSVEIGTALVKFGADVAGLSTDVNKAVSIMSSAQSKFAGIAKGVGLTLAGAFSIGSLIKFNQAVLDLAEAGDALGDLRENFGRLGGTISTLNETSAALGGVISQVDILTVANDAFLRGIPEVNKNLSLFADYAARLAESKNLDTKETFAGLIEAISKGTPKALKAFGVLIEKGATFEQILVKLKERHAQLAPVQEDVNRASTAAGVAFTSLQARLGLVINENENLAKSWRTMATELDKVDWEELGKAIAAVANLLVQLGSIAIPVATSGVASIGRSLNALFGDDAQARADRFAMKISSLKEQLKELEHIEQKQGPSAFSDDNKKKIESLKANIKFNEMFFKNINDELVKAGDKIDIIPPKVGNIVGATGELEKKTEKAKEAWEKLLDEKQVDKFESGLKKAIDSVDVSSFNSLIDNYQEAIKTGFMKGHEDAIAAGVPIEEVQAQADDMATVAANSMREEMTKALEESFQKSVDFWENIFQNAITGVTFNLKDALEQVAVGFAAQIAASFAGNLGLGGISGPKDIGSFLASSLLGGGSGGGFGGLVSGAAGAAAAGGIAAAGMGAVGTYGSGLAAGLTGTTTVASSAAGVAGVQMGAQIAALGPYALAIGAGLLVANEFGLFSGGATNVETLAREKVEGFLEDAIKLKGGLQIFDEKGEIKKITNFVLGSSTKFNNADWTHPFTELDTEAQSVFGGLGTGLTKMLGITEDVSGQIGALLAENLLGNIDNARMMVEQLGLDITEMENAVVESAKRGEMSYHAMEVALQGIHQAFEPGIAAAGAFGEVFDSLINGADRGIQPLRDIKSEAVEAMEAGITSLEQLKQSLLAAGKDPNAVGALFQAIDQRGIHSLEELANVSDRVAGGIIADMQSLGVQFKTMADEVDAAAAAINAIPDDVEKTINFNIKTNADEATVQARDGGVFNSAGISLPAFASGGIVNRATMFAHTGGLGIMGEAGPEAILPLERIGGELGVRSVGGGNANTYVIDARGAGPGVDQSIRRIMEEIIPGIVEDATNAVADRAQRGGSYSPYFEG